MYRSKQFTLRIPMHLWKKILADASQGEEDISSVIIKVLRNYYMDIDILEEENNLLLLKINHNKKKIKKLKDKEKDARRNIGQDVPRDAGLYYS